LNTAKFNILDVTTYIVSLVYFGLSSRDFTSCYLLVSELTLILRLAQTFSHVKNRPCHTLWKQELRIWPRSLFVHVKWE